MPQARIETPSTVSFSRSLEEILMGTNVSIHNVTI